MTNHDAEDAVGLRNIRKQNELMLCKLVLNV